VWERGRLRRPRPAGRARAPPVRRSCASCVRESACARRAWRYTVEASWDSQASHKEDGTPEEQNLCHPGLWQRRSHGKRVPSVGRGLWRGRRSQSERRPGTSSLRLMRAWCVPRIVGVVPSARLAQGRVCVSSAGDTHRCGSEGLPPGRVLLGEMTAQARAFPSCTTVCCEPLRVAYLHR